MNAKVSTLSDGRVGVVAFAGEIDFSVIPDVRRAFDQAVAAAPKCLIVDLSDVTFIASDGLGVLIETQRQADADGRKLQLVHPQPHILGLFRKTQLTRLFQIRESLDEALKSC